GEQSMKLLRSKKSEDVIFSGSRTKSALSFAEVALFLNNADRAAPIDFQEIVVTRRLYRDGESEYLLNGSRVRLLDVSLLLAKAHFGQRAYSVIGQGMVENFLNTTLAERKEFFDEATGVKMYQIKRDDAMNKLQNARGNLAQAGSLFAEIEPRMRSLTRQMKRLEQRTEVEEKLRGLQRNYYAAQWHALNNELKEINKKLVEREQISREEEKEIAKISRELGQRQERQNVQPERARLEGAKSKLEAERNNLFQAISEVKARIGVGYERAGKTDAAWLIKRGGQLEQETAKLNKDIKEAEINLAEAERQAQAEKTEQEQISRALNERRGELNSSAGEKQSAGALLKQTRQEINELLNIYEQIFICLEQASDIASAKKHLALLQSKLRALKEMLTDKRGEAEKETQQLKKEIFAGEEKKQAAIERYIVWQGKKQGAQEKIKFLKESLAAKLKEQTELTAKLAQADSEEDAKELKQQEQALAAKLATINKDLAEGEKKLAALQAAGRQEQEELMKLQKLLPELQMNANANAAQLNEIKIIKARVETKLEDLENEIRNETNNLRAIIDCQDFTSNIDRAAAGEQIKKLKRQLELIGGIDPEVKKEYEETKTRFEFLSSQTADLESGITSLEKVVVELDKTIATKFDKAFAEIAAHFEKYFKVLFKGGGAKLVKIMEDLKAAEAKEQTGDEEDEREDDGEPAESRDGIQAGKEKNKIVLRQAKQVMTGIEIEATPPGKKIKSIAMLSGGERALTAIALICAIISVNPSPFVVLDEVDAALDEANSGRLSGILEELAHKTQFIVITHNRSLMYQADIIYGVTMGADGVSQLLSLKIEEAAESKK
ncbi:MAG: AAA family ATPase, partial [Patescibacteria group bacterium]